MTEKKTDEITYLYADITKTKKLADGSIIVAGAVTNPKVDLDGQIADPKWIKEALPDWFNTRANIREMHQASAVGHGTELDMLSKLPWLTAKIVDPLAVKKVEEGIYSGYSIGVKGTKLVRDDEAKNGRIVGGRIVEVSIVDYPAADVGKLTIAKAAVKDETFVEVSKAISDEEWTTLEAEIVKDADAKKDAADDVEAAALPNCPNCPHPPHGAKECDNPLGGCNCMGIATKAAQTASDVHGLTPESLRAEVLRLKPDISEADLNALLAAFQSIPGLHLRAGGNEADTSARTTNETNTDPVKTDESTATEPAAATSASSMHGSDQDTPTTGATKPTAAEMDGNIKAALAAALPEIVKTATADLAKVADVEGLLLSSDTLSKVVQTDVFKAALSDAVKAAVEAGTKDLRESVAKLASLPSPRGAYVGDAKRFAATEAFEREGTPVSEAEKDAARKVAIITEAANSRDPHERKAAREALLSLAAS